MADDWKEGLLVKIPKRGDLCECKHTLLSVPSKVFTRILLNRIKKPVMEKLSTEQPGFRENRACVDQINTLRIIIEQSMDSGRPCILVLWILKGPLIVLQGLVQ
jgi:hypothetical protein